MIKKMEPNAPKLYVLQENNSTCVLYALSYKFYFIGDKMSTGNFKDEITTLLKANDRLKFFKMWH